MTRAQCETLLLNILELAFSVYKCYNPDGENLSLTVYKDQYNNDQFNISDALTDENGDFIEPADYDNAHSVYITKFSDGKIKTGSDWRRIMMFGGGSV